MGDPSRRNGLLPPGVLRWPRLRAADLRPDVAALLGTLRGAGVCVALAPALNLTCHPPDTQSALFGCLQAAPALHDSLNTACKRLTQDTPTSLRQEQSHMYMYGSWWGMLQAARCPSRLTLPYLGERAAPSEMLTAAANLDGS